MQKSNQIFETIFHQFGIEQAHAETASTSVDSLPVQDLRLNRGDDQITHDFIGDLKSFSVSGPSIGPVIDIDVTIKAFRSYFPMIPLDLNRKPPTFPTTHFLSRITDFRQFISVHFKHVITLVFVSPDKAVTAADFARNILGQERLRGTRTLRSEERRVGKECHREG
jgi:hypothetical protein